MRDRCNTSQLNVLKAPYSQWQVLLNGSLRIRKCLKTFSKAKEPPPLQNDQPFSRLTQPRTSCSPLCLISDVFFGWATDLANSLGTVNVSFKTSGAYGFAAYTSVWLSLPHRSASNEYFTIPGFPEHCRFHISQLSSFVRAADGTDSWDSLKLHVWCVGPLIPADALKNSSTSDLKVSRQRAGKELGFSAKKCLEWLDSQGSSSVIYISFGSQNTISATQMMELAVGLEESGKPFVWVIRPPVGFDLKGEFRAEWLPHGFEEIMSKRKQGLLVHNWAPHHCGWNSVMESLSQGVPIVGWPLAAEQAYNSKMLVEEMGVSVELTRVVQSNIGWKEVKEGGEMRKNAGEIKGKIRGSIRDNDGDQGKEKGSSVKAMEDFVAALLSKKQDSAKIN
ncbi:UDP-glycosyltransferase 92A1-like [Pyrus ussuriensis x Pyrus communis]|uniref:UDP-glycosyltransferase 92A1-like n=1 Tax=Pyrus ussuriensis x Pyrus communis TaxID=2448454 RepID=A0A5N5H4Y5_9ROSA|nr:UDP-glycosyltransferase 92A1-like [Pyrus ussuriensis x Pyrus communis]